MASLEPLSPDLPAAGSKEEMSETDSVDAGHLVSALPVQAAPVVDDEPIAAEAAARVATEASATAAAMVQNASVAATNVLAKASHTAEVAVHVAAIAAADIVSDAEDVADAMVVAAASAADTAQTVRQAVAGAISAESAAKRALADSAQRLSEELKLRIEIETQLLAQEAELTAFAGMVAHDLKAPLRAAGAFTQMLRRELTSSLGAGFDEAVGDRMDRLTSALKRMSILIDDLLAFATARDHTLHPRRVNMQELVQQVIAEHSAGQEDDTSKPTIVIGPLLDVQADPSMCRQLLDNLIGNAFKYTAPGTTAHVTISCQEDAGMVRVEIADHGVGVPEGQHELVFSALHRSHSEYPGTGLGLAICQRIVNRHGGVIGITANGGQGSNFYFTLPTADPDDPEAD